MAHVPYCCHEFAETLGMPVHEGLHVHSCARSAQYMSLWQIVCDIACRYLDLIRGVFDCPEALINTGVAKCAQLSLFLSSTTWARCKTATLLPVCVAEPTCFTGWSDIGGE